MYFLIIKETFNIMEETIILKNNNLAIKIFMKFKLINNLIVD